MHADTSVPRRTRFCFHLYACERDAYDLCPVSALHLPPKIEAASIQNSIPSQEPRDKTCVLARSVDPSLQALIVFNEPNMNSMISKTMEHLPYSSEPASNKASSDMYADIV